MVETMSSRERVKTVFFMAMLHFIFYTLFSRDVVCSVMLDSCAIFAVSTNCWPESAPGALLAAGKTAPRGDAIFFDCDGSSSEKILVIRRFTYPDTPMSVISATQEKKKAAISSISLGPRPNVSAIANSPPININVAPNKAPLLTIERRCFGGVSSSAAKTPFFATNSATPCSQNPQPGQYLTLFETA